MKAWIVRNKDLYLAEESGMDLVYAESASRAKSISRNEGTQGNDDYLDLIGLRLLSADRFHKPDSGEYVETDNEVFRALGWQSEGGKQCVSCDLDDFDDDRWRVCPECDCCVECGHDSECNCRKSRRKG